MISTFLRRAKAIAMLCVIHCALSFACAQIMDPVHFKVTEKELDDNLLEVTFAATIDPGWHVYGADIADGGPTRAELTVESITGAKPQGKLQAKGKAIKQMDDMFGMELTYYEHSVSFVQLFKLTGGKCEIRGYLTYGACNDESCMPPTNVDFNVSCEAKAKPAEPAAPAEDVDNVETADNVESDEEVESVEPAEPVATPTTALWEPVTFPGEVPDNPAGTGLLAIFFMGFLGGLLALLTPCVWPIIPMTVSFFLKRSKSGVKDAVLYGLSIVVIYMLLGLVVTGLFGASALNELSTNAVFNLLFCAMLVVFAASFFGAFELALPASWSNAVDGKAEKATGLLSIFLMAFTLALVSFSCTGPIIGFLLVEVASTGELLAPMTGMLGFSIALALPFTLFALFPTLLKKAPRSGGWMNRIKVVLGFIELAFALKFFSVADMAYGWRLLDREVFLVLWIMLFTLLGLYMLGVFRFQHDDEDDEGIGVTRFAVALASLAFALYMVPGLWGAPLKAISAFAPPMNTQDFKLGTHEVHAQYYDYEQGMAAARREGKPVMLDFTGFGCVNCRKMEAGVWTDPEVADMLTNDYVLITLYVDDRTKLENDTRFRTVGEKWSALQREKFGANAQPFYVLLDATTAQPLAAPYTYNEDVDAFKRWLKPF